MTSQARPAPSSGPDATDRPRRLLAAVGDARDPRTMSGLPYHFELYGRRAGLVDGSATDSASERRLHAERLLWNAWRKTTLRGHGGYQYSALRAGHFWRREPDADDVLINIFQLFPRPLLQAPLRRWFFIDQTLTQLWDGYGQRSRLSRGVAERTWHWERDGYAAAEGIIVNSTWAQRSLVEDYGVPPERTAVVLQAANVDPAGYAAWATGHTPGPVSPSCLRLVFVGSDWWRKGLDRLLLGVSALNRGAGVRATLEVVGMTEQDVPTELRQVPGVTWHGFVNKQSEPERFFRLLGSADVGCLLSRAEAGGNCLREYHAAGLAVLGTSVGGAGEQTLSDATWLVGPAETVDDIAERLAALADDPDEVNRRKQRAWAQRTQVLWPATLAGVDAVLRTRGA